jgi:hypothetical protein
MTPEIIAALVGIGGIAIGACLQFFFTRYFERRKEGRDRLLSTYKELLRALNALASAQAKGANTIEEQRDFETAKTQFLLDASQNSIKLFSVWMLNHGKLDSQEARSGFSELINQLRSDCIEKESDITETDIRRFLFREET